jgi:agmatine deiminase
MRMPAEWEKQEAIWLAWPHNKEDWPGKFETVAWAYGEILKYLSRALRIRLLVKNKSEQQKVADILDAADVLLDKVDFITAATDRSWLRDSAPTFVYDGNRQKTLLHWHFNAWAKYDNWQRDSKVPLQVKQYLGLPLIKPEHKNRHVVLEGGAIDVNGKGTLITTEECLLSKVQCRNPGFTREDYEEVFSKYLGISHTIWLGKGIVGDDTHGHIDDLARFVNASTVVAVVERNKSDPNHGILNDNLKRLKRARDQAGRQLAVAELPMPKPVLFEGVRLPASYANFLIANDTVLVPVFNDANDRVALNILSEIFPKHKVVGIYCGDFVLGLGTIHCASQQEPK